MKNDVSLLHILFEFIRNLSLFEDFCNKYCFYKFDFIEKIQSKNCGFVENSNGLQAFVNSFLREPAHESKNDRLDIFEQCYTNQEIKII